KILLLLALAEQTSSKIIISRELNNLRQHLINLQKAGIITKQESVNLPGLQVNSKTTWKIIPQAIVWWFIDVFLPENHELQKYDRWFPKKIEKPWLGKEQWNKMLEVLS
ncbi:MAG: hypothetical protein DWQ04_06220, partial [Chloroflexi bacterium]